jgi:hypothetical protein
VDTLETQAAFGIQDKLLLAKTDLDISRDLNPSKAEMTIGIKIRLVTGNTKLRRSDLYITKDLTLEE